MELRRNARFIAVTAACLIATAPGVFAGDEEGEMHKKADDQTFNAADRDRDGRLDRDEYDHMSRNEGATAPSVGDGVPATEHQANVIRRFEERDRDGDGYITAAEWEIDWSPASGQ